MDQLLAGYGSSDDEDETQKEEEDTTLATRLPAPPSSSTSSLFSKLPPPSASTDDSSKGKKRTVSLLLPIPKEALRAKYEDEFMRESGPALPEAPKPSGLNALLPAPKNPNPAKRSRLGATPTSVRRHMEESKDKDKTDAVAPTTTSSTTTTITKPSPPASESASRPPAHSLRTAPPTPAAAAATAATSHAPAPAAAEYAGAAESYGDEAAAAYPPAGSYEATAYEAYAGYEAYYQQQHGYAQGGYDYSQQQSLPQTGLPEPSPEFAREWEQLTRGAKIVEVSQAQITDKTGWSKEFIQENLAKASASVSAKDRPAGTQRRKHQITALAFEAKQREMELLNQRANARKTKSETWGKYGW